MIIHREHEEHPVMRALALGLPITLLVDLIDPTGPRSVEMLRREARADADQRAPFVRRTARPA